MHKTNNRREGSTLKTWSKENKAHSGQLINLKSLKNEIERENHLRVKLKNQGNQKFSKSRQEK